MTRTIEDYAKHDDDCSASLCLECGFTIKYHVELGWVKSHVFVPQVCTCGLDALLSASAPSLIVREDEAMRRATSQPQPGSSPADQRVEDRGGVTRKEDE